MNTKNSAMANKRIPFYPNQFYHVFNKAVGSESLFYEDKNFQFFLSRVKLYICPIADIYAFCLMPNHFHLLVKTKNPNVIMKWWMDQEIEREKMAKIDNKQQKSRAFNYQKTVVHQFGTLQNAYTKAINKLYQRKGGLFSQSINRKIIENKLYLTQAINYIHNNAVHHGFCNDPDEWKYSSYNSYIVDRPTTVKSKEGLAYFGDKTEFIEYSKQNEEMGYSVKMELYY